MSESKPQRDEKGKILPGSTSLNPKGKPKQTELAEACRALTPQALETLQEIMLDSNARNMDRIKASQAILERGHGKVPNSTEDDGSEKNNERYTIVEIPVQKNQDG